MGPHLPMSCFGPGEYVRGQSWDCARRKSILAPCPLPLRAFADEMVTPR